MITFPLDITKKNPFYTNVVNLFALPKYSSIPLSFSGLSFYDDFYLLHTVHTGSFLLVDTDFQILHRIDTIYQYIGDLYFTDGIDIFAYSPNTEEFSSVLDVKTGLPLQCKKVSYYGEKLFCYDTMQFIGPNSGIAHEEILAVNDEIMITPKYIYNQDTTNKTWKYFEYQTGSVSSPEAVVHINKIPYILEK